MDELLPYYERELGIFRHQTRAFAARYPKTAGSLLIAGDSCEDPHVERLIQSFALLTARVHKRLDDDYPQLTEALLETLLPHYLRPFPSCSIARIGHGAAANGEPLYLPRGTPLRSPPVRGVTCLFRTAYPVRLDAVSVARVSFDPIIAPPVDVRLADGVSSLLSFTLDCGTGVAGHCALPVLRLFVDAEPALRAALLDSLFMRAAGAYVQPDGASAWHRLPCIPLAPVGYAEDDALIPFPVRAHPALRLLTEYFAFPEKFNFIDIDLAQIAATLPHGCGRFTLHLALKGLRADSSAARLLGGLAPNHLLAGCTPVVNLFDRPGVPIKLTHTSADYPLLADAAQPAGYDIYAVRSAQVVRKTPGGDAISTFLPLYANEPAAGDQQDGTTTNYWLLRRDTAIAASSPGHEYRIALIDTEFEPDSAADGTLSTSLTCSNRDLPVALRYGQPQGDLHASAVASGTPIHLLRRPTPPQRFDGGAGAHWRLIAHLALNYTNLTSAGLDGLHKMLTLYDLPRSAVSQRQIGGITGLAHGSTRAWIKTLPCATLMPGVAIRLTIDEQAFVGSGVFAFAHVLDHYFALNRQLNCYSQLTIVSQQTGEELLSCPPHTAEPTKALSRTCW